jgi:hypothetical protein
VNCSGKKIEARKILKHGDTERSGTAKGKSGRNCSEEEKHDELRWGKILKEDLNCSGSILKEEKQGTAVGKISRDKKCGGSIGLGISGQNSRLKQVRV